MSQLMYDFTLDDYEDIDLAMGDFILTESTPQHQRQLLLNTNGDFKENPTIGVGALSYIDDENFSGLVRAVNIEFSRDGMEVHNVSLSEDGTVVSNATYTQGT
jgi:hypothetical protein